MKQIKQNSTQIPVFTENFAKFLHVLVTVVVKHAELYFPFAKNHKLTCLLLTFMSQGMEVYVITLFITTSHFF